MQVMPNYPYEREHAVTQRKSTAARFALEDLAARG